jgi:hypothetical protein
MGSDSKTVASAMHSNPRANDSIAPPNLESTQVRVGRDVRRMDASDPAASGSPASGTHPQRLSDIVKALSAPARQSGRPVTETLSTSPGPVQQEGTQRTCFACGKLSPKTETAYTLISAKHGWRVTRMREGSGRRSIQWRCPDCWARWKASSNPTRP